MRSIWTDTTARRALIWSEAMTLVTVVHHFYRFGFEILIPSLLLLAIPVLLMWWYSKKASALARWAYVVNATLVFIYFGIIDGFFDHVLKALGLQNSTFLEGSDKAIVETIYHLWSAEAGHAFYESTGILTFLIGLGAMYFSFVFLRTGVTALQAKRVRAELA